MPIGSVSLRLAPIGCIDLPLAALTSCSSSDDAEPTPPPAGARPRDVAANVYPIEWLAERVGGEAVSVTDLTSVGEEPHNQALIVPSRQALEDSAVAFHLGSGFPRDVEKAVEELNGDITAVDPLAAPGVSLLGLCAGAAGLLLSCHLALPAGPTIAIIAAALVAVAVAALVAHPWAGRRAAVEIAHTSQAPALVGVP